MGQNNKIFKMVLLSPRYTLNVEKTIRQSNILLRLFLCFDVFFLISAVVNLVWFSPSESHDQLLGQYRRHILLCIIGFFSTSLICNSLAIYGVTSWKRGFVLPWLLLFFSSEDFLSPGFHQQCFEPSTECRPALSFVAFDVNDFILEAHSNPVYFDGLASSFFGNYGCRSWNCKVAWQ